MKKVYILCYNNKVYSILLKFVFIHPVVGTCKCMPCNTIELFYNIVKILKIIKHTTD